MVRHVIVGTAGHVDHGKSALVTALTGQDPDRLPEEKRRGLTIEPGYAWCDLESEDSEDTLRLGFVDVPGHERFIDHMVSGVTGMDLVLFTVAADEGMMPQSFEHLEIMRILGVRRGIVVVTKCDRSLQASVDALITDIQRHTKGTFLERADIIQTSARTGEGIEDLKRHLARLAAEPAAERTGPEKAVSGPARLPVDRVFSLPGFGTIVTGTLISGTIGKDSRLTVYPKGMPCRLRSMQSYGQEEREASAGQRVALNLAKISVEQVTRGDVIATEGSLTPSGFLHVSLQPSRYDHREIGNGMRVHLLIGTAHVLARLYLFRDDTSLAELRLESPVAVAAGDRFILRFYSPLETIGGGTVLETVSERCRMSDRRVLARLQALARGEEPPAETDNRATILTETEHPGEIPAAFIKCTEWLTQLMERAGCRLISVNTLTAEQHNDLDEKDQRQAEHFGAEKILRSLRLAERSGKLVRLDEAHYTTGETADGVKRLVKEHFSTQEELTLSQLRDILDTNRTSARAFFAYLDRRKITVQTGGAAVRSPGPAAISSEDSR